MTACGGVVGCYVWFFYSSTTKGTKFCTKGTELGCGLFFWQTPSPSKEGNVGCGGVVDDGGWWWLFFLVHAVGKA